MLQSGIWMIQTSPLMRDKPGTVFCVELPRFFRSIQISPQVFRCFDQYIFGIQSYRTLRFGEKLDVDIGKQIYIPPRKPQEKLMIAMVKMLGFDSQGIFGWEREVCGSKNSPGSSFLEFLREKNGGCGKHVGQKDLICIKSNDWPCRSDVTWDHSETKDSTPL